MDMDTYLQANIFLPDINNERASKNSKYKQNLVTLNKFVLYQFTEDSMVVPRDSSVRLRNIVSLFLIKCFLKKKWFGFYKPGDLSTIIQMQQQPIYTEDWIGLKVLDQSNRLVLGKCPGEHMQFTLDWFQQNVIVPYLNNTV